MSHALIIQGLSGTAELPDGRVLDLTPETLYFDTLEEVHEAHAAIERATNPEGN